MDQRSTRIPPVSSVMRLCPHTIDARAPATEALARMQEYEIRHLPVVRQEKIVGMVSERDIAIASSVYADASMAALFSVETVCSPDVYMVEDSEPLSLVASTMAARRIGSAAITHEGKLVGIVTTTDLLHALTDLLLGEQTPGIWRPEPS